MTELSVEELGTHLQTYLNDVELWKAFEKQVGDPHVKEALTLLIGDGQEAVAVLAGQLRRRGVASGARELDGQGRAVIQEVLATRALGEQLLAVRRSLADLVAWYQTHLPVTQSDSIAYDWLASLSAQIDGMLERWDQHMDEMKAAR